jgi:hypothetical protein
MSDRVDEIMKQLGCFLLAEHIPVSEEMIEAFEKEIGSTLPELYREVLRDYGFSTAKGYITFSDIHRPGKRGGGVEVFYGPNPGVSRDVLRTRNGLKGRVPDNVLPIADSPGGEICLGIDGPARGKIFWWDRSEPSENPSENLKVIAEDFERFLDSLRKEQSR